MYALSDVATLLGTSLRKVQYLCESDVVVPVSPGVGTGHPSLLSQEDVVRTVLALRLSWVHIEQRKMVLDQIMAGSSRIELGEGAFVDMPGEPTKARAWVDSQIRSGNLRSSP